MNRADTTPAPGQDDEMLLIEHTLEDSFPASDPPSWTTSVARPAPADNATDRAGGTQPLSRSRRRTVAVF